MKNQMLLELNFSNLLRYDIEQLKRKGAQTKYDEPLTCTCFCTLCELKGFATSPESRPAMMSHACDSSDYEQKLGSIIKHLKTLNVTCFAEPVLFLLEDPGGHWDSGCKIECNGFFKQAPTKHYYWMPHNIKEWPSLQWIKPSDRGGYYGDYFAYLMVRHGLINVYITNLRKCKWKKEESPKNIDSCTNQCVENYLSQEIGQIKPRIVFCFGRKAENGFDRRFNSYQSRYLYHPACRKTREEMVQKNDEWISSAIKETNKKLA